MLLLGLVVLVLAHWSALTFRIQSSVSLWFPPSGVAIALTLWLGPIGAILTGIASFIMAPFWGAHGWMRFAAWTDAIEPLTAWFLYRRCWRGSLEFKRLRDAIAFILSAPISACFASALVGTLTLVVLGEMPYENIAQSILNWWLGNAIGVMTIAVPALFWLTPFFKKSGWVQSPQDLPANIRSTILYRRVELLVVLSFCAATAFFTVSQVRGNGFAFQQFAALNFISIIWVATRWGAIGGTFTASFCVIATLIAYLVMYPTALSAAVFPIDPEVLHVHKLNLLVQCCVSLLVGVAVTQQAATQVALATEQVRLGEYEARARLMDKLEALNQSLETTNAELQRSNQEKDQLLVREQAARTEAESANRIKDEFLAVLSHELRSPLNPILGWTKLLQSGKCNAETAARALDTIERNAKLQAQLIEDLLDVSRILRGKLSLTFEPVNLVQVIQLALETVQHAIDAKSIQLQLQLDPDVGTINGDPNRLQQVVWNLLSNAVKFTPDNGAIAVRLEQIGKNAQIIVADTGKGIDRAFLPYVFEHFRQEDSTITRKFGGLGLGLAIVRHLVEIHGGTVGVDSRGENQGATFTVTLPLSHFSTPQIESRKREALPLEQLQLADVKILVVDDEEDMRELVRITLELQGAIVAIAASATEALQLMTPFKPDVVVSDIGMPNVDGYQFMRQIKSYSSHSHLPAIALTAYASEWDQQQAIAAGFDRHLSKPIQPNELVEAVAALIA